MAGAVTESVAPAVLVTSEAASTHQRANRCCWSSSCTTEEHYPHSAHDLGRFSKTSLATGNAEKALGQPAYNAR